MSNKKHLTIVGAGVAGLSLAWILKDHYKITLIEKQDRFGGHSHTVSENTPENIPVDTGFIVFNPKRYPGLCKLLSELNISPYPSEMSFSFSSSTRSYSSLWPQGLLQGGKNIQKRWFWHMIIDIFRFKSIALNFLKSNKDSTLTMESFLKKYRFSDSFINNYVLPMGAAIWSANLSDINTFPAYQFLYFWKNHQLFNTFKRPQWQTIQGGSKRYVSTIIENLQKQGHSCLKKFNINEIKRDVARIQIKGTQTIEADYVAFCCHADEILPLLCDATETEKALFSAWSYNTHRTILHTDTKMMPRSKYSWAAWNVLETDSGHLLSYYMNKLQPLPCKDDLFVSLIPTHYPNASNLIDPKKIIKQISYAHPLFNKDSFQLQTQIQAIQGQKRSYYSGSYLGYGFHEDAIVASQCVAKHLGVLWP